MAGPDLPVAWHEATHRRTPLVLGGLLAVLALAGIAAWLVLTRAPGAEVERLTLAIAGASVVAIALIACLAWRTHRWTVHADGVSILQRPLLPFTGRTLRCEVPYAAIAALERAVSGAEQHLVLRTRDGRRFILPAAMRSGPYGIGIAQTAALDAFAARIRAAAATADGSPPAPEQGLSFWHRPAGLVLLGVLLLFALEIAAVTVWALWQGARLPPHLAPVAAAVLLLPAGVGLMLWRVLAQRRAILARRSPPQAPPPVA